MCYFPVVFRTEILYTLLVSDSHLDFCGLVAPIMFGEWYKLLSYFLSVTYVAYTAQSFQTAQFESLVG
jgi:hypothetical protein